MERGSRLAAGGFVRGSVGSVAVVRTSTRRERSAMAYLLMSITPAGMHRQRVYLCSCKCVRACARARLRCFAASFVDFSISSHEVVLFLQISQYMRKRRKRGIFVTLKIKY